MVGAFRQKQKQESRDQKKLRNVRRDPRMTISFATGKTNAMGLLEYLVVHGTASVIPGGAPELLQKLAYTYIGPDVRFEALPAGRGGGPVVLVLGAVGA